jgi:hypothetical protein
MIDVGLAFNFNIQRCEIEVGEEQVIADRGYQPLVDTLLGCGMKADFFISGFSTRRLLEIRPRLVDAIRENVGGAFELGTYTYTHPIPQLLKPLEFERQVARGLQIDREVYGRRPAGFLPPEFAYSREMAEVLLGQGVRWLIVLSSTVKKALPGAGERDVHRPVTVRVGPGRTMTAVPAVYQLPKTPARYLKRMMKGEIPVEAVIEGVTAFAEANPDTFLLFKRDAETIFIDAFNSGFTRSREVFEEFIRRLAGLPFVRSRTIGEVIAARPPAAEVSLEEYLGNTRIETFTEGAARPIWELTVKVRDLLMEAEAAGRTGERIERAWEHLLLSHNSDGRIGYWYSEWNPGEHVVAPSRRRFVEENLQRALEILERG